MVKQHYYQILFLLGSLLTAPLHAAVHKNEEVQQHASEKSFYTHGDLTFIDREKDKVNQKELKQGLIDLSQRIQAKGRRKVYFFIGASGAGKSLSILALQGNKIKKEEEEISDDSDDAIFDNLNNQTKSLPKAQFEIVKYVLPKDQVPIVGDGCKGKTVSTYIYYPDPKQPEYKGIAFADTEGFFGKRKATSAEKCLSAISFFYAAKANIVGGIVLVISKTELDASKGEGLKRIAHILQEYFGKAISKQRMKRSVLVMITKIDDLNIYFEALAQLRQHIQFFYEEYYTEPDNKAFLNLKNTFKEMRKAAIGIGKAAIEKRITGLVGISESYEKKLEEEIKKKDENRRLKLFFEMLLEEDVPKDKIGDINNFRLDKKRFCFILPWEEKSVQNILDTRLKSVKSIYSNDLSTFDNPVSQYIEASIRDFSSQLHKAILPLLVPKRKIDRMEKQLEGMTKKIIIDQSIEALKKEINRLSDSHTKMTTNNTLEVVFEQSHYEKLPVGWEKVNWIIDEYKGYRLCDAFRYRGQEPIYKIVATYGPKAVLSENHLFWDYLSWAPTNNFIEKHFMITTRKDNSGLVLWEAVAKNDKGVIKEDGWCLYHATTGKYRAQCDIKFYARKSEQIATRGRIKYVKKRIKSLKEDIADYKVNKDYYNDFDNKLKSERKNLTKKLKKERTLQIKKWAATAHMLQFFANEILEKGADKALIKEHLENFEEATQLKSFTGNNHHPKEENENSPYYWGYYQSGADENQLNGYQSADDQVFDID